MHAKKSLFHSASALPASPRPTGRLIIYCHSYEVGKITYLGRSIGGSVMEQQDINRTVSIDIFKRRSLVLCDPQSSAVHLEDPP